MTALLVIWGWLLIGAAIGRMVFVRILGDSPRRAAVVRRNQYGWKYETDSGWTDGFTRAVVAGVACLLAWPVALPVALMLSHTGTEKLRAQRERLQAEVAELQKAVSDA